MQIAEAERLRDHKTKALPTASLPLTIYGMQALAKAKSGGVGYSQGGIALSLEPYKSPSSYGRGNYLNGNVTVRMY